MTGYGEYKNTGYDWLPAVPAHWDISTIRSLMQLSDTRCGVRSDLELLSVYREYGVIKKKSRDDNHNKASLDISNYKYVGKYHVVMNKMKMWQGSLGVSAFEGIVSPAYIVCIVKKDLNLKYLNFLLRSHSFKTFYNRISYGIRVGQWDLRYDDLKALNVFLPPREEQDQIARYLDDKVGKINTLIKIKQKQIALLKEKKQAIINQAVTKGLDPNAPMKDSGIAWIGQIPEGWTVERLKFLMDKIVDCPHETPHYSTNGPYFVIRTADQDFGFLRDIKKMYRLDSQEYQQRIRRERLLKDDVVYGREGERWGLACLVPESDRFCLGQRMMQFRCNTEKILPSFAVWMLNAQYIYHQGSIDTIGSTSPHVNIATLRNYYCVVPCKQLQETVSKHLNDISIHVEHLVKLVENEIEALTAYRTRLISDVVTGKIDVRSLPVDSLDEDTLQDLALEDVESMESEDAEEGIYDTP